MPNPILPIPIYPDVPNLPGVPPLLRNSFVASVLSALLTSDVLSTLGILPAQRWGVFNADGSPVILPDSFVSIDFSHDFRVSNYPQETGAFSSYNKVQTPYDARIRMTKGGTSASQTQFLDTVEAALNRVATYAIVTPEKTYRKVTLTRYDYTRSASNGARMIIVDLAFEEIREAENQTFRYTATATPSGAAVVNTGPVQPITPLADQIAAILGGAR